MLKDFARRDAVYALLLLLESSLQQTQNPRLYWSKQVSAGLGDLTA